MNITNLPVGGSLDSSQPISRGIVDTANNYEKSTNKEISSDLESNNSSSVIIKAQEAINVTYDELNEGFLKISEYMFESADIFRSLSPEYKESIETLKASNPELLLKDWDLGVGNANELIIFTGEDQLSKEETALLIDVFDNNQFKDSIASLQQTVIDMSSVHFATNTNSGFVGHYDLSEENINSVYRARETMDAVMKNGPGAEYNIIDDLADQLLARGDSFLKSDVEKFKFVDIFA